ncbi:ATP-binding protein [Fulvivirgaceae bacterium BMA12]|uniref:histidine kinase n=1 Tax=Agaribacillus aureus TaxID=3051825 RepID=A0ABT8LGT4_9BACT|nr:ATP-binding protein [Fulvivirgaceae bacterium BMA12]
MNSRGLALLLAASISVVTTAFLSLVNVSVNALIVTFVISFSSSYLLIHMILNFLIFNEIKKMQNAIKKLNNKEIQFNDPEGFNPLNPLKRIQSEIHAYAVSKQQEIDQLKKTENFRREFIADISHELKTPIFSAQGFVHTLLDGAIEDKKVRQKFLKKAAKSLDGLDILVQDLLTLSQMETGQIKMQYERFNVFAVVNEVFEQLEGEAEKKEIDMGFTEFSNNQVFVVADQQRIYQVMLNLISNAIKYTRKQGSVRVGFEKRKKEVLITVSDNGRGIPDEDIKRIFERFYRVEKSRSKDKGGTGLGLAIVKHVLEAHDTRIEVQSKVEEGSTFSFALPTA